MLRSHFLATVLAATSALALSTPARAQFAPPPAQPQTVPTATPDADALAASMRRLAENPRDLDALLAAGELSLKVGDASGAAALFKRAEGVDPMNGRIKAGMARILVTQERPGEALRYFDQAVGYGLDPRTFAGDRGLAFDLIGEQERAQRDYRLALKTADNDEVRRRYALSLGISGRQDAALAEIDTLLRRNDRGAWRARAFILAMTGDLPGATGIATRMMPPAMAQGLQPFFVRLPTLSATDKAFAVHFGEVRATPERVADARLIPVLPVLGPDPDARVRVAAVAPAPQPAAPRGRHRRRRGVTPRVLVASAAPKVAALPPAPGFGAAGESPTDPARRLAPTRVAAASPSVSTSTPAAASRVTPTPTRFVRRQVDPIQKPTLADYAQVERYNRALEAQARAAALRAKASVAASPPPTATPAGVQLAATVSGPTTGGTAASSASSSPLAPAPTTVIALAAGAPAVVTAGTPPPTGPAQAVVSAPAVQSANVGPPSSTQVAPAVAAAPAPGSGLQAVATVTPAPAPTAPRASEDSILARIVAGLSVPGYELGVGPPPAVLARQAAPPVLLADAPGAPVLLADRPGRPTADTVRADASAPAPVKPPRVVATRVAARQDSADRTTPRRGRSASPKVELAATESPRAADAGKDRGKRATRADLDATKTQDVVAAGSRRHADRRALAARDEDEAAPSRDPRRRTTDRRALALADQDAPKGKGRLRRDDAKETKAEPPRIWVQVAGGANQDDLPKAWSAVQSRAPALKGRPAYSTPLRATNRVVTGPFKTDAEARAFVNQLAKQGVSAFPFTSDKGQKLAKLPPR